MQHIIKHCIYSHRRRRCCCFSIHCDRLAFAIEMEYHWIEWLFFSSNVFSFPHRSVPLVKSPRFVYIPIYCFYMISRVRFDWLDARHNDCLSNLWQYWEELCYYYYFPSLTMHMKWYRDRTISIVRSQKWNFHSNGQWKWMNSSRAKDRSYSEIV